MQQRPIMQRRVSSTHAITVLLFVAVCLLGGWAQMQNVPQVDVPRARFNDATPLGGKGFRLLLERLGYQVNLVDGALSAMPKDARVWILIDPQTGFTTREANDFLNWVKGGGTALLTNSVADAGILGGLGAPTAPRGNSGAARLRTELGIATESTRPQPQIKKDDELMPTLTPLQQTAASDYWSGVTKASGSSGGMKINRTHIAIAGTPIDTQLARIDYGRGRFFVAPDALMFTNYALSKPDNAVLVTNLIRLHQLGGTIYFDERNHGEDLQSDVAPNLLYYLWRPPLRYALLQLLVAGVLFWAFYGRRLGSPVPLPDGGPVTRASQFASAMGALFQKVQRPQAAQTIIGDNFRRQLTRRLGLSISDPDDLIAQRTAEATGYSSRVVDRLLLQGKTPDVDEARALADAQLMEQILRSFDRR